MRTSLPAGCDAALVTGAALAAAFSAGAAPVSDAISLRVNLRTLRSSPASVRIVSHALFASTISPQMPSESCTREPTPMPRAGAEAAGALAAASGAAFDSSRAEASRAGPPFPYRGSTSTDASSRCGAARSRPVEMGAGGEGGRMPAEPYSGDLGSLGGGGGSSAFFTWAMKAAEPMTAPGSHRSPHKALGAGGGQGLGGSPRVRGAARSLGRPGW